MRTISLYAQRKGMSENYMSDDERKDIDQQIWFEEFPDIDRDMAVAKEIAGFLNNDRAEFIYVNKLGAHFSGSRLLPGIFCAIWACAAKGNTAGRIRNRRHQA